MSDFNSSYKIKLSNNVDISLFSSSYDDFYMIDEHGNRIDIKHQFPDFYVVKNTNDSNGFSLEKITNNEMIDVLATYKATIERELKYDFSEDCDEDYDY